MTDYISNNILHITIGTTLPLSAGEELESSLDISHELRLLKAAILYADRVKFCSFAATSFLSLMNRPVNMNEDEKLEWFLNFYKGLGHEAHISQVSKFVEGYRESKRNRRRDFSNYLRYRNAFEKSLSKMNKAATKANMTEFTAVINSKLVEFKSYTGGYNAEEFVRDIAAALDSGTSYPLLDERTGKLIDLGIKGGRITPLGTSVSRAKQVGLSTGLFSRLPLFDEASVDEIIDIRKELDRPLKRFRSGVVGFSREIESAPWNNEFSQEVEQIFIERVEPAVLEIEDAYKSSRPLLEIVSRSLTHPSAVTTSALGIALSRLSQFPDIFVALSAAAGVSFGAYEAFKKYRQEKQDIEKNQLYFYYRVGKSLSEP
jgi:hypothetical protein